MLRVNLAACIATYVLLFLLVVDDALLLVELAVRELRQLTRFGICRLLETGYADEFRTIWKVKEDVWGLLRPFWSEARVYHSERYACHTPVNATSSDF
jgi:hypothetical protein